MTKFQALFVLWLRHESFCGCSWRALAGNYHERYNLNNELIPFECRESYKGIGANQIIGMRLEKEAFKILRSDRLIKEPVDLYECDLTLINANLKNNIKL